MRITRDMTIAGVPAVTLRDGLRRLRNCVWSVYGLAAELKLSDIEAAPILTNLLDQGLVEFSHEMQGDSYYVLTVNGIAITLASASRPIKRKTADRLVAELIARAEAINDDPMYVYDVSRLIAFGSFVTDSPDLGDVDISVEVTPRLPIGTAHANAVRAYADAMALRGRKLSALDRLGAAEADIYGLLKGPSQYLSIHVGDDVVKTATTRVIYERAASSVTE